jgi:cobalt-zinc-cadmium efflux system outer membrane protein
MAGSAAQSRAKELEGLTLQQALEVAGLRRPELASLRAQIEASRGAADQAGLFPNPIGVALMEAAPFSGPTTAEAEYILGISQPLVLGGRLSAAARVHKAEEERLLAEAHVSLLDIRRGVQGAFATVLYLQDITATQGEHVQIAEKGVEVARVRLDAGEAVPNELLRAELELARARLELERARSLREQAVPNLVAELGDPQLRVLSVAGALDRTLEIPTLEILSARLSDESLLAPAKAEVEVSRARLRLAESQRIPDVNLDLFYRRLAVTEANAFDVGISVPLPIFDRNQGRVREMRSRVVAAESKVRLTRLQLDRELSQLQQRLKYALLASRVLKEEVLPRSEQIRDAAEARYAGGDSSLTDVLLVRREYIGVKLSHLESLREVLQAWADLSPYVTR